MTTLTINLPDNNSAAISDISRIVDEIGGHISIYADDDLTDDELAKISKSYKEALMIKDNLVERIPASKLWDE